MFLVRVSVAALLVISSAACTSDSGDDAAPTTAPLVTGTTPVPQRSAAVVIGPVEGAPQTSGAGAFGATGYVEEEYFVTGSAVRFDPVAALADDGRWDVEEGDAAPFTTRILVKRPENPGDASGVVLVEWNNVSAGFDGTPDWSYTAAEMLREGHVHIGVSAQEAGVDGEAGGGIGGFGAPLATADPDRYGDLSHPGDPFSYDIFRQVGRLVRGEEPEGPNPLEGYPIKHVLASGESQSAFRLTTYINAIHPLDRVFDGFLVHSRGGGAAPLDDSDGLASGIDSSILLRDDLDEPVLVFTTETDLTLLGYADARQPDSASIRNWEVAGTAHADAFLLGGDPQVGVDALGCPVPINDGPQHVAMKAALAALTSWVSAGTAPPSGERIEFEGGAIVRDHDGLAIGGIRLPSVEVPFATLSGDQPDGANAICSLFGKTVAFGPAEMTARYGSSSAYVAAVDEAYDDAVDAGFALEADRAAVIDEARTVPFG